MKIIESFPILTVGFFMVVVTANAEPGLEDIFLRPPEQGYKNVNIVEVWEKVGHIFKNTMKQGVKYLLPEITENFAEKNVSRECVRNLIHLMSGLSDVKAWAIEFIDSSGKLWDGLLTGTMASVGSYNECLNIKVNSTKLTDKRKRLFNGQYCSIDILPPKPLRNITSARMNHIPEFLREFIQRDTFVAALLKDSVLLPGYSLRIGVCTPSGCSKEDVTKIVGSLGEKFGFTIRAKRCEIKEDNEYTPLIIGVITYYSTLTFLVIVATLICTYMYYTKTVFKKKLIRILLAFDFITNYKKFKSTTTSSTEVTCLHGIRFLTMTWIILNHTYLIMIGKLVHGAKRIFLFTSDFFFQVIVNGSLQTDVFFFMAGFLLIYVILTKKKKNPSFKVTPWTFIVHRILRIFPSYSFAILSAYLVPLFGSGPIWHDLTEEWTNHCYDNVWANFLFINNFYKPTKLCMPHTWFVAAEFQLYLSSFLIVLIMLKWRKIGVVLMFLPIISCVIFSAIMTYVHKFPPAMLINPIDALHLFKFIPKVYIKPFSHAGPYAVGMLTGYLLATRSDLKMSKVQQVVGWFIAIICSTSTLYATYKWNNGVEATVAEAIIFAGVYRTVFCVGLAWMIICCATGHADIINYILSLKIFIPLGRLTFFAYLFHPVIMIVFQGSIKQEMQVDHFIPIWLSCGHLCVSYAISFVSYFLVEVPFSNLEGMLFNGRHKGENLKVFNETNNVKEFSNQEKNGDIPVVISPSNVESSKV